MSGGRMALTVVRGDEEDATFLFLSLWNEAHCWRIGDQRYLAIVYFLADGSLFLRR